MVRETVFLLYYNRYLNCLCKHGSKYQPIGPGIGHCRDPRLRWDWYQPVSHKFNLLVISAASAENFKFSANSLKQGSFNPSLPSLGDVRL